MLWLIFSLKNLNGVPPSEPTAVFKNISCSVIYVQSVARVYPAKSEADKAGDVDIPFPPTDVTASSLTGATIVVAIAGPARGSSYLAYRIATPMDDGTTMLRNDRDGSERESVKRARKHRCMSSAWNKARTQHLSAHHDGDGERALAHHRGGGGPDKGVDDSILGHSDSGGGGGDGPDLFITNLSPIQRRLSVDGLDGRDDGLNDCSSIIPMVAAAAAGMDLIRSVPT